MSRFVWLGGRPALDLCNTVTPRGDLLLAPDDIAEWLIEGGFGEPARPPSAADVALIRLLRDELRSGFLTRDAEVVADLVADWLKETPGRLAVDRTSLRPSFCPEVSTCRCLLVPTLLDALDLARDGIERVRECASETCGYVYADTSRNGSRRWCSMERCGSRAKAHAYYTRRRATGQPPGLGA